MSKKLKSLLTDHPSLNYSEVTGKVTCSLSGHEMPYKEEAIRSYVTGKKYIKLLEREDKNYEKYKPHLVPSTKKHHEHQLFCTLTMCHVNKTLAHVERHVNGGKFKRFLARWEECQRTGKEYRPPRGRRKVQENLDLRKRAYSVEEGGEDDEGEISDTDSLSDLYPADKVTLEDQVEHGEVAGGSQVDEDDDSDFEFEEMETENIKQSPNKTDTEQRGQKRNKFKAGRHSKQSKKKMQKIT
ncbi:surfeit locus protein 2-like isoform X2 [Ruditapes philippinarum]|uniref:surfeit locus protein 2-like isoform X2 n=1 Tax=Ruditapes philippinarum TaxID=129788 RepID=UPI00295B27A3|nr:surfeit locus protein 2-like isoform X2 [Ruditapes philippinarum]